VVETNKIFGMMRTKLLLSLVIFIGWSLILQGQDLHYSYYHFTPLSVNPANSGAFSGSYRVSGIYTRKDFGLSNPGYQNFSLSADAPIIRGIRKQDWIGIGVQADVIKSANNSGSFYVDNLNDPNKTAQNWTFIKISAAYHFALDKKQTNILTLGAQMSNGNRSLANFTLNDTRAGIVTQADSDLDKYMKLGQNGDFSFKSRDISLGLLFNARAKNSDLRLGVAMEGLFSSKYGILSNSAKVIDKDSVETKFLGLNVHGDYRMDINKRVSITPSFNYYSIGAASAFNINSHVWYQINPDRDLKGGVGLGLRNVRDIILYVGAEFNDIQVGFAYDVNIDSKAIGSDGFGGLELAARYIGKIYKKPKVKPIIFCPRL
jgi:type IX secretion system PorP/SprF family membrane protein